MFRHGWQLRTIYSYDYCRLEKGRFKLPEPGTAVWELSHNEMQWLFSGISISRDGENTIVTNGDDQITLSNIEYAQFSDDLVDLRATGWEITDTNDLRWFDVASNVDIILNQSDLSLIHI